MKKTNYLLSIVLMLVFTTNMLSQDKMFLKSGENIESKILEVKVDEVKYKKYSNLDGPTFTIAKKDIHMVIYENGETEIFKEESVNENTEVISSNNNNLNQNLKKGGGAKIGLYVGLPTGDFNNASYLFLGGEFSYLAEVAPGFELGGLVGYSHYFIDDDYYPYYYDVEDVKFLPIAFSTRFYFGERKFFAGMDLGFAIGLDNGNDGGFFYRPKFGFNLGNVNLIAAYRGVSVNGVNVESLTAGIEFNLN